MVRGYFYDTHVDDGYVYGSDDDDVDGGDDYHDDDNDNDDDGHINDG
jgi:hypothetical protein